MRAIVLACVCATGCELYFGPSTPPSADDDAPPPDAAIVVEPDATPLPSPPDPPATCSTVAVYVAFDPGDSRGPFVTALIEDALAFYHVPITTTAPTGAAITIQLSPTGEDTMSSACVAGTGATSIVADPRSLSNAEIVAHAVRAIALLDGLPKVIDAGDCLNDIEAVPGCVLGRATTISWDQCGLSSPVDEAQMLANSLGCP